jgi:hypothetical protein
LLSSLVSGTVLLGSLLTGVNQGRLNIMDPWLTDQVKELLFRPCLSVSGYIGRRLNNRLETGQEIDERALTEDLVDRFDTSSSSSAWGTCAAELRDMQIYISTSVRKSTVEHRTGADIGLVLRRSLSGGMGGSRAEYACLIQQAS